MIGWVAAATSSLSSAMAHLSSAFYQYSCLLPFLAAPDAADAAALDYSRRAGNASFVAAANATLAALGRFGADLSAAANASAAADLGAAAASAATVLGQPAFWQLSAANATVRLVFNLSLPFERVLADVAGACGAANYTACGERAAHALYVVFGAMGGRALVAN